MDADHRRCGRQATRTLRSLAPAYGKGVKARIVSAGAWEESVKGDQRKADKTDKETKAPLS